LMVSECNAFIDAHKDRPFFLFWALNMPHYPLQGRAKWREYYKNLPSPRSTYAACVSSLDGAPATPHWPGRSEWHKANGVQ
jgi:hypothetical protein